jgi:hypothetical protein
MPILYRSLYFHYGERILLLSRISCSRHPFCCGLHAHPNIIISCSRNTLKQHTSSLSNRQIYVVFSIHFIFKPVESCHRECGDRVPRRNKSSEGTWTPNRACLVGTWTLNRACRLVQSLPIVPVWSCRLVQSLLVLWSWDRPLSYCVVRPPGPGIPIISSHISHSSQ